MKLIQILKKLPKHSIIMISGYGGSGKSTLARNIQKEIESNVICIDDFYQDKELYHNWDNYDFKRFIDEVIIPFKEGKKISYKAYNWVTSEIDQWIDYENKDYLIIEGVGLFEEDVYQYVDYSIWIDCNIEVAVESGKKRDKEVYGVDFDLLWDTIWKKNDLESFEK